MSLHAEARRVWVKLESQQAISRGVVARECNVMARDAHVRVLVTGAIESHRAAPGAEQCKKGIENGADRDERKAARRLAGKTAFISGARNDHPPPSRGDTRKTFTRARAPPRPSKINFPDARSFPRATRAQNAPPIPWCHSLALDFARPQVALDRCFGNFRVSRDCDCGPTV